MFVIWLFGVYTENNNGIYFEQITNIKIGNMMMMDGLKTRQANERARVP